MTAGAFALLLVAAGAFAAAELGSERRPTAPRLSRGFRFALDALAGACMAAALSVGHWDPTGLLALPAAALAALLASLLWGFARRG